MKETAPALLLELSTFLIGRGFLSCRRVSSWHFVKLELMIIPSALLSNSARLLISLPECFPTRDTRSVIKGLLIFHIVSLGTGSELMVSNNFTFWTSKWGA